MTTMDMVREGCIVSFEKMMAIAEALGVGYEHTFVLQDCDKIKIKKWLGV